MIEHEVDDMNFVLDRCNLMKYEEILSVDDPVTSLLFLL